jgi:hypothetical protein
MRAQPPARVVASLRLVSCKGEKLSLLMPPKADQVKQGVEDKYKKREKRDILKKARPIKVPFSIFL